MVEERRRYFRVTDDVGISCRLLTEQEAQAYGRAATETPGGFDFVSNFDNRIHTLLDACKVQSPVAAELLGLMNKKLNFVIQQMGLDAELINRVAYSMRQANISACGVAFGHDQALPAGQQVELDIMLQPEEIRLSTLATVVGCDALPADEQVDGLGFFVRLNFDSINATDQELLIQHVVKRQSKLLRVRQESAGELE